MDPEIHETTEIVKLMFEAAMLKRTERTGYAFLGTGRENSAAHSFSTAFIALLLGKMVPEADSRKLVFMALIHDLPEARTGDANAVHKKYIRRDEMRAFMHAVEGCSLADDLMDLYREYHEGQSLEARLARDADQIDMLVSLKEQMDCGNPNAERWIPHVEKRLMTPEAKRLAQGIRQVHWAAWWMDSFNEESAEGKRRNGNEK
ncbi:MAG: phosphohydrolase [Thermodesulfatator sp.]|nr:MAG: phosphohydrolase [Thermodesulfatator sp.]